MDQKYYKWVTQGEGALLFPLFFVWSTCYLSGHWHIASMMERQPHSWVKTKHLLYLRGCCTCAAEMGASQIARMHVCTRTLRCYLVCNQAVQIWGIMQSWIVYSFLENVHSISILPLEPSSACMLKPIYFCAVLGFDSLQSSALGYARVGD